MCDEIIHKYLFQDEKMIICPFCIKLVQNQKSNEISCCNNANIIIYKFNIRKNCDRFKNTSSKTIFMKEDYLKKSIYNRNIELKEP